VLVSVGGEELRSHNVIVEDDAVLPPCIAFTRLPFAFTSRVANIINQK
jgi:hypothetical protein